MLIPNVIKRKEGYIGIVTCIDDISKRTIWKQDTAIYRLTPADAKEDAIIEVEYLKRRAGHDNDNS